MKEGARPHLAGGINKEGHGLGKGTVGGVEGVVDAETDTLGDMPATESNDTERRMILNLAKSASPCTCA